MEKNKNSWLKQNPKKALIFVIVFLLLFIEVFSFFILKIYDNNKQDYQKFDAHTFFNYKPNKTFNVDGWNQFHKNKVQWRFDDNGLVFTQNNNNIKNLPEKNIVIFGGSTVFGVGSSSTSSTIASLLHKILNEKNDKYFYKVHNAGVRGYFSYQEFNRYLNDIRHQIDPDIVIDLNGRNDVYLASKGFLQKNFDTEYSKQLEKNVELMKSLNQSNLITATNSGKLAYRTLRKVKSYFSNNGNITAEYTFPTNTNLEKSLKNYILIMETFKFAVEKEGKKFFWFLQPVAHYKKDLTDEEKRRIRLNPNIQDGYEEKIKFSYNFITNYNKNIIDITDSFEDIKETLYIDDCHFNDKGNEILANKMADILLKNQ